MRKKMALGLAGLVVGGATLLVSSASAAMTLTVIEHADTDHFTDIGKTGFSPGDLLTFGAVRDPRNSADQVEAKLAGESVASGPATPLGAHGADSGGVKNPEPVVAE